MFAHQPPPRFSRLQATVADCELFAQATIRIFTDAPYTSAALSASILPFFAIDFSRGIILRVGPYKMDRFLNRLRGSLIRKDEYRCLVAHVKDSLIGETVVFSPEMEEWRVIILRNNLTERLQLPDWIPILNHLAGSLIVRPRDLALWSHAEISALAATSPESSAIIALFQASLVACAPVPSATPESSWHLMASAHALAGGLRAPTVSQTICARAHESARAALRLPDDFHPKGPAAKIRCLAQCTTEKSEILRFLNTGAQVNILHQVQDSLKSVASGIQ